MSDEDRKKALLGVNVKHIAYGKGVIGGWSSYNGRDCYFVDYENGIRESYYVDEPWKIADRRDLQIVEKEGKR